MAKIIGRTMMGFAVAGAVVTMFWLLWLSLGVMDSWASKENVDKLPGYSREIGFGAALGCLCTMLAVAAHCVLSRRREDRKGDLE